MKKVGFVLLSSLLLLTVNGCSSNRVQGAYLDKPIKTARGMSVGGVSGMIASTLAGVSSPISIILGAGYGGAIGSFQEQIPGLSKTLYEEGGQLVRMGDIIAIYLPIDNYFKQDSTEFKSDKIDTMARISRLLKRTGNTSIVINGYSDDVMDEHHSYLVSELYAQRVMSYLWTRGIPLSRFRLEAKGIQFPIATNLTPTGSAHNRYVLISINPNVQALNLQTSKRPKMASTDWLNP